MSPVVSPQDLIEYGLAFSRHNKSLFSTLPELFFPCCGMDHISVYGLGYQAKQVFPASLHFCGFRWLLTLWLRLGAMTRKFQRLN